MYKIDKNTWDVMRNKKNKVVTEDFSRVNDHNNQAFFDESKLAGQVIRKGKQETKINIDKIKTDDQIQETMEEVKRESEIDKSTFGTQEKKSAKQIEKSAYEKGYSDCAEKMTETISVKLNEFVSKQNDSIANLKKDLNSYKEKLNNEILENTLGLSLEMAEKILDSKLEKHDDLFIKIVKNAISHMDSTEEINVKLSHKDYQKYFISEVDSIRQELGIESLNFSQSPDLEEGGCIVETNKTFIDAGVHTQLKVMADAITKEAHKYDEAL